MYLYVDKVAKLVKILLRVVKFPYNMAVKLCLNNSHFRYSDLFEGIGGQVVNRMLTPVTKKPDPNINPSIFLKQVTGIITLLYCIFSVILLIPILGAYLLFPEKKDLVINMLAVLIPGMVLFTAALVACCLWVNRKTYLSGILTTSEKERCTSSHSSNGSRDHDSYLVPDNFIKKSIIEAPMWQEDLGDLQDPRPDYQKLKMQQEANMKHLEFLKYTD